MCSPAQEESRLTDERIEVDGIVGRAVRMVSLYGGVQIEVGTIGTSERFRLRVESPGELTDTSGKVRPFVPLEIGATDEVATLLGSLLGAVVSDLDVRAGGSIRIAFSNGIVICVPPGKWEAWEFHTPSGHFISLPGGGLA